MPSNQESYCKALGTQNDQFMNSDLLLPVRLDWPSTIGTFLLGFGNLDSGVFSFLEGRMTPDKFVKIKNSSFQDRIKLVKDLVQNGDFSSEQKLGFDKFFTRLDPIRELRNHIAHGYILLRFEKPGKPPVLTLSLPKELDSSVNPQSRQVELQELIQSLGKLTELIEEFHQLSGDWSKPEVYEIRPEKPAQPEAKQDQQNAS
jgi:hypothetical protein